MRGAWHPAVVGPLAGGSRYPGLLWELRDSGLEDAEECSGASDSRVEIFLQFTANVAGSSYFLTTSSRTPSPGSIPATPKPCGDPTEPPASYPQPRQPEAILPLPHWVPCVSLDRICSTLDTLSAKGCFLSVLRASVPSHHRLQPITHLVPIRTSVWMRGAPDWWFSVWALPMTPMTSSHGPSVFVSKPPQQAAPGTRRLTDGRAGRVQGKVQPARAHQLLDLRDLGRHRGGPRPELSSLAASPSPSPIPTPT